VVTTLRHRDLKGFVVVVSILQPVGAQAVSPTWARIRAGPGGGAAITMPCISCSSTSSLTSRATREACRASIGSASAPRAPSTPSAPSGATRTFSPSHL
jgi:hypothetical protein